MNRFFRIVIATLAYGILATTLSCKNQASDGRDPNGNVNTPFPSPFASPKGDPKPPVDSFTPVLNNATADPKADANNLKQLAMAMHNFNDSMGYFPSAIFDKDGKPLLSWRVAILPYIQQQALYQKFKLDEPWDGPNNKALISQMPNFYATPGVTKPSESSTHYRILVSEPNNSPKVFRAPFSTVGPPKGRNCTILSITDGTSITFMIVESEDAVPWTSPQELEYSPQKPLPKFAKFFNGGFQAAWFDGSTYRVGPKAKEAALRKAIQCNDDTPLALEELQ